MKQISEKKKKREHCSQYHKTLLEKKGRYATTKTHAHANEKINTRKKQAAGSAFKQQQAANTLGGKCSKGFRRNFRNPKKHEKLGDERTRTMGKVNVGGSEKRTAIREHTKKGTSSFTTPELHHGKTSRKQ